ncbi:INGR1 protein, partial [Crocuta crocuta]
ESLTVPKPTNIQIKAHNFNTVLSWDYPTMSETPVFTVQVKNYVEAIWIDACNTSHHYCNIFSTISDPSVSLWARIKARLGQKESAYVESKEFILCRHGKIGSPDLSIRKMERQIVIDIFHPLAVISGSEPVAIYGEETCYTFKYTVHLRIDGNESSYISDVEEDNCNETQCHLIVPVSSLNSEYCASVEGNSDFWGVTTNKSKEVCVSAFDAKHQLSLFILICDFSLFFSDSVWVLVVAAVFLSVVVVIVLVCCYTKKINPFKRQSIMLPKSLLSVVKNASSETKSESKCISPITYQPVVTENEKMVWEEHLSPATISDMPTADDLEKMEHHAKLQVVTPEGDLSDTALDSPLTPALTENSVHSDSNQSETCVVALNSYHSRNGSDSGVMESQSLLDSELPPSSQPEIKTEGQESVMLRNTTTSFGYDKPHVLVDLLVDEGAKESLIGYRLTADSKEFS